MRSGPSGSRLIEISRHDSPSNRVARALVWLQKHFAEGFMRQRVASEYQLPQLCEINFDTNGQKRTFAARAHNPGGGGHIDGREQVMSCSVLEMRGAEVKTLFPL